MGNQGYTFTGNQGVQGNNGVGNQGNQGPGGSGGGGGSTTTILYYKVTGTSLTSSTTPALSVANYGYYYNIVNTAFNAITIPTISSVTNGFWVLRNNTGSYLSIGATYTTSTAGPATIVIPPFNSVAIVITSGSTVEYVFF
jgi:hypothetical protein